MSIRAPLPRGTPIGRYIVADRLGEGGCGQVLRAHDRQTRAPVALKILTSSDAKAEARLAREAQALARLAHPGIVRLVGPPARAPDGRLYFPMELVAGQPLDRLVHEGRLDLVSRVRIVIGLARAVAHAHAHDVLHRDIKPANVIVRPDGQPVLVDFGIGKLFGGTIDGAEPLTAPGNVLGTLGYLAPEQLAGRGTVGVPADIYGLAATLYEMLTGHPPFVAREIAEMVAAIFRTTAPPASSRTPRALSAAFPTRRLEAIDALIEHALRKDPTERPATASAFADALAAALDGDPSAVAPAAPGRTATGRAATPVGPAILPRSGPSRRSRAIPLIALVALVLLPLSTIGLVVLLRGDVESATSEEGPDADDGSTAATSLAGPIARPAIVDRLAAHAFDERYLDGIAELVEAGLDDPDRARRLAAGLDRGDQASLWAWSALEAASRMDQRACRDALARSREAAPRGSEKLRRIATLVRNATHAALSGRSDQARQRLADPLVARILGDEQHRALVAAADVPTIVPAITRGGPDLVVAGRTIPAAEVARWRSDPAGLVELWQEIESRVGDVTLRDADANARLRALLASSRTQIERFAAESVLVVAGSSPTVLQCFKTHRRSWSQDDTGLAIDPGAHGPWTTWDREAALWLYDFARFSRIEVRLAAPPDSVALAVFKNGPAARDARKFFAGPGRLFEHGRETDRWNASIEPFWQAGLARSAPPVSAVLRLISEASGPFVLELDAEDGSAPLRHRSEPLTNDCELGLFLVPNARIEEVSFTPSEHAPPRAPEAGERPAAGAGERPRAGMEGDAPTRDWDAWHRFGTQRYGGEGIRIRIAAVADGGRYFALRDQTRPSTLEASFDVPAVPSGATLVLRHLTATLAEEPGHAPVSIAVNGTTVVERFSPNPESTDWTTDRFDIGEHLVVGANAVTIAYQRGGTSAYWIAALAIDLED